MKWHDLISEEVRPAHRHLVMAQAQNLLEKRKLRREFIWGGLGLGFAALAASFVAIVSRKNVETSAPVAIQELGAQDLKDLDMVAQLELLEDLEVLEKWEPS